LNDVLEYPSSQMAKLHKDCNRVGNYDVDEEYQEYEVEKVNIEE
jgi:hypothetical protein